MCKSCMQKMIVGIILYHSFTLFFEAVSLMQNWVIHMAILYNQFDLGIPCLCLSQLQF